MDINELHRSVWMDALTRARRGDARRLAAALAGGEGGMPMEVRHWLARVLLGFEKPPKLRRGPKPGNMLLAVNPASVHRDLLVERFRLVEAGNTKPAEIALSNVAVRHGLEEETLRDAVKGRGPYSEPWGRYRRNTPKRR